MGNEVVTYFIRMPHILSGEDVSGIDKLLRRGGVSVVDAHNLDKVPAWKKYEEPVGTDLTMCDGMQAVFAGNPRDGFDFEGYVNELSRQATLARGIDHKTGEPRWVLSAPYHYDDFKRKPAVVKRFNWDVMRAMAQMSTTLATQERRRIECSSKDGRKRQGMVDLIEEAESHGLKTAGFYYAFAGVPLHSGDIRVRESGLALATGMEIIAEGPFSGVPKEVMCRIPYTSVYVGGRLVA